MGDTKSPALNVAPAKDAVKKVYEALNTLVDTEVQKNKRYKALPQLEHAAKALALVESHIDQALARVTPKPPKAETAQA